MNNTERCRAWYKKNREAQLSVSREYRKSHKLAIAVWRKKHYLESKERLSAQMREYYRKNQAQTIARVRAYAVKNKEKISLKGRAYRKKHADSVKVYQAEYRKTHRTKAAEYRESRRGVIQSYNKKYRAGNPEAVVKDRQNRRARKKGAVGKITKGVVQRVYEDNIKRYGTLTCYLCERPIEFGQDSLEHKIPLVRGGTNLYENLAVAHLTCNSRKGRKTPAEYLFSTNEIFGD